MKVLLDSHALVWFLTGNPLLPSRARAVAEKEDTILCVSAVTAWEIANKVRLGKWPEAAELTETLAAVMEQFSFEPVSITIEHARMAGLLPGVHRDPFDRMLAAQSQIEGMPLMTGDPVFATFGTRVLW
jgi:PIN domain nuclease of toxin-antitoxin system